MAIPHSKPVEASLPAVKATVSLLQWQRQASPPTPLRQPKRACYNRHLLRSTSQRACYKRLLKEHGQTPPTSSAYGGTLVGLEAWKMGGLLQRWGHRLFEERDDVTVMLQQAALASCFAKQQSPGCCCKPLTAAAMAWRQAAAFIYCSAFPPVSTLYAFSPSQLTPIWLVSMLVLTLLQSHGVVNYRL